MHLQGFVQAERARQPLAADEELLTCPDCCTFIWYLIVLQRHFLYCAVNLQQRHRSYL